MILRLHQLQNPNLYRKKSQLTKTLRRESRFLLDAPASITPELSKKERMKKSVPVVRVQYEDAEVTWFLKFAEQQFWMYRSKDTGVQPLSSLMEKQRWVRRRNAAVEKSESLAMDLLNLMAVRNSIYRTPCKPDASDPRYKQFEDRFAYSPTSDQLDCFKAIENDMVNSTRPMDRLICGDVGFGKTEVAMRAIYRAVLSGKQVALLAPTRVLAKQHERTLKARMPDINVQLLRGGGKGDAKSVKAELLSGKCQVVVGTHALLQPTVSFSQLGLLVIDEEQRFGVAHKERLKASAANTDVLTLSATPIPRTLQMSLSGLRDFSQMNSPPKVHVGPINNTMIKAALENEFSRNGQVFVVVPLVRHVEPTRVMLESLFEGDALEDGSLPIKAYAYVMTNDKNITITAAAEQRLTYLETFTALGSGYELSRRDMEMRGSGTLFGSDQSGSQDVGMDLQARMLSTALENFRANTTLLNQTAIEIAKNYGQTFNRR
eukprot:gene29108-38171_t